MIIDPKELTTRLWTEWKNGMKIMVESLLKDSSDLCFSGCTIHLGAENFIQRAVMYLQRKSYIGKFKDYKTRISAYETTVMELIDQVNKMLPGKIAYSSTLADIIIDGDERLENTEWGNHAMEAFGKLSDYLGNIMDVLDKAQKEIGK